MARIVFLIDGFNLYHSLDYFAGAPDHGRYKKYKWLSLRALAARFVAAKDQLAGVEYFTTIAGWDAAKAARHRLYIRALEAEGVKVVYGNFKRKDRFCPRCRCSFPSHEEKETDVNIALRLFELAVLDQYDRAVLVSGDSDLLPAMAIVQRTFPGKKIGVLIPIGRSARDLQNKADFHFRVREQHLAACQLPDPLVLRDGTKLAKPPGGR